MEYLQNFAKLLNTSALTEGLLTGEPLRLRITSLLLFLHLIKLFKVFHVSLELLERVLCQFSLEIVFIIKT